MEILFRFLEKLSPPFCLCVGFGCFSVAALNAAGGYGLAAAIWGLSSIAWFTAGFLGRGLQK